jgi:hypothetical protein
LITGEAWHTPLRNVSLLTPASGIGGMRVSPKLSPMDNSRNPSADRGHGGTGVSRPIGIAAAG